MSKTPPKGKKKLNTRTVLIGAAVLVLGYLLYRKMSGGNQTAVEQQQNVIPVAAGDASMGLISSAGTNDGTLSAGSASSSTADTLAALGAQQQSLLDALAVQRQSVADIAQTQILAAQGSSYSSSTDQTQPVLASQPGGSYAPTVTYVTGPTTAQKSSTEVKTPTMAPKYYTYRNQVPLAGGQTLHFRTGKGYYAA